MQQLLVFISNPDVDYESLVFAFTIILGSIVILVLMILIAFVLLKRVSIYQQIQKHKDEEFMRQIARMGWDAGKRFQSHRGALGRIPEEEDDRNDFNELMKAILNNFS